jgi:type VI secretion system protein ImpF
MPAPTIQQPLMPSLLTRLLDPDSLRHVSQPGFGLQNITDSVRFDMEDLFNTRRSGVEVPKQYEQVQNSIVTYGLPDMTYFDIHNNAECEKICRMIVALINRFEPRLRSVRVSVVKADGASDRQVRFHIEGLLAVDPAPEVGFDTVVELATGKTSVETKTVSA